MIQDLSPARMCIDDKSSIHVHCEGTLDIVPDRRGGNHSQVLYLPSLGFSSPLYPSDLPERHVQVEFDATAIIIRDQTTGQGVWSGRAQYRIYKLSPLSSLTSSALGDLFLVSLINPFSS